MAIIVAANLFSMVTRSNIRIWEEQSERLLRSEPGLLQIAAAGPDLVPTDLQDRVGMIDYLVEQGYNPYERMCPDYCLRAKLEDEWLDPRHPLTPLGFVLTGRGSASYDEVTRLAIVKNLLSHSRPRNDSIWLRSDAGNFTEISLLSFCALYQSPSFVDLLLHHGAKVFRDHFFGWSAFDYAVLRQDQEMITVFKDCVDDKTLTGSRSYPGSKKLMGTLERS